MSRRLPTTDPSVQRLRERVAAAVAKDSLREVAERIGISQFPLWKLINGGNVRPATLEAIRSWLDDPDGEVVVTELRRNLRRALGKLPRAELINIEEQLRRAIVTAFEDHDAQIPGWVWQLGRKGGSRVHK